MTRIRHFDFAQCKIFTDKRKTIILLCVFFLFCVFMAITMISLKRPLAPALQSVWFIPHVAVYMFAYAVLACATILAFVELSQFSILNSQFSIILIKIGTIALGFGLCFGALWAKKAWGQYWSWDIKETAALITWAIFLLYLHLQKLTKINRKYLLIIVIVGFLSLQFTWLGVKYLPSSKKTPHTFYNAE